MFVIRDNRDNRDNNITHHVSRITSAKRDITYHDYHENGASLLEMLFAIMIMAIAMPFAYRQIHDVSSNLRYMNIARDLINRTEYIKGYMRLNDALFPMDEFVEAESEDADKLVFIRRTEYATTAFVVLQNYDLSILSANRVRSFIGDNAAVVEEDGVAYSAGGNWSVMIEDANPGDLILRISNMRSDNNAERFLHKTTLADDTLSTMQRDLFLGNNSIQNAGHIDARRLTANDLDINLVRVPAVRAGSLFFPNGLNLNPTNSTFQNMRVTGDITGFRNITGDNFTNRRGGIITERATVNNRLVVTNRFEVRSPTARSVGGFAGISASSARVSYLDTEILTFVPDFGLVVSSEMLYSTTAPLRIGNWNFPNAGNTGPRFNQLYLGGNRVQMEIPDFSSVVRERWR